MSRPDTNRGRVTVRALRADDAPSIRALALPGIDGSRYAESARSALDGVLDGRDPDSRALVAVDAGRIAGIVILGSIAGAVGTGRLQLIVVERHARRRGIATQLIRGAIASLVADGMRIAVIELPDDPTLGAAKALLLGCGFHIVARVADYFRDGVDLAILQHDLRSGGANT